MKIKIAIKNRFTGSIIFEFETEKNTVAKTINEFLRLAAEKYERADLTDADLTDADLTDANLTNFRNDIWAILLQSNEVDNVLKALKEGKVNGSVYEGECACLVGTIANSKGCKYNDVDRLNGLKTDSNRPAERWFMQIQPEQTPENSNAVKLTVEWIEEFKRLLNIQKGI